MRREDGGIIVDGMQVGTTRQCVHCGGHFESVPGSGKVRGWCLNCSGITCGHPSCMACVPVEARLEHAEGKSTRYTELIRQLTAEGALII